MEPHCDSLIILAALCDHSLFIQAQRTPTLSRTSTTGLTSASTSPRKPGSWRAATPSCASAAGCADAVPATPSESCESYPDLSSSLDLFYEATQIRNYGRNLWHGRQNRRKKKHFYKSHSNNHAWKRCRTLNYSLVFIIFALGSFSKSC